MGRRPILPVGRWGPLILGILALGLLAWGAVSGNREMIVIGSVGAAGLLVAFPLADFLLHRDEAQND